MNSSCYSPFSIMKAIFDFGSLDAGCMASLMSESIATESSFLLYAQVFLLTCILEFPIYFLAGYKSKLGLPRIVLSVLVLNLATHPIVYWVIPSLGAAFKLNMFQMVLIAELFAPIIEALLLRYWLKYNWRLSIFISLLANLFSWWIGSLVF